MPLSENTDAAIRADIQAVSRKIDELSAQLPNTYVTIRQHEVQIRQNEDKITGFEARLIDLEHWRHSSSDEADKEHTDMRREWKAELKAVSDTTKNIDTAVAVLAERFGSLNKILIWILGIISSVATAIIITLIVAYINHLIR